LLGFEAAKKDAGNNVLGKDPLTKDYYNKDIFALMQARVNYYQKFPEAK